MVENHSGKSQKARKAWYARRIIQKSSKYEAKRSKITPGVILATFVSVVAAAAAAVAAIAAVGQVNLAHDQNVQTQNQNVAAEQQELVTLVGDIAQDPATIAQENQMITNANALSSAEGGLTTQELVDSEEAAALIHMLPAKDVTATEYYETAFGLQVGQSYAQSLSFLKIAVTLPSDP